MLVSEHLSLTTQSTPGKGLTWCHGRAAPGEVVQRGRGMPGIHFYPTPSLPAVSIHTSLGLSLPPEHQGSVPSPLPVPSVDTGNPYGWQYSRRWPAGLWNVAAELPFVPHARARGRVTLENPGRPCTGQRGSHQVIPLTPGLSSCSRTSTHTGLFPRQPPLSLYHIIITAEAFSLAMHSCLLHNSAS